MNVFVLCTGRSGSVTFVKACEHIENYTAGHETRSMPGPARMAYPPDHIEADNRLSWMLGRLDRAYGDEAFYVHLRRDPAQVAASYNRRWHVGGGIARAYDRAILRSDRGDLEVCLDLVDTIESGIELFLRDKTSTMEIWVEDLAADFPVFAERIGAEVDMEAAMAELDRAHNAGVPESASTLARTTRRARRVAKALPQLIKESG